MIIRPTGYKILLKTITLSVLVSLLTACNNESAGFWQGYAWNKAAKRPEFWFNSYDSYESCIKDMRFSVRPGGGFNSVWYGKPIGCSYSTNSLPYAVFNYLLHSDSDNQKCLWESYNIDVVALNAKYSAQLTGYPLRDQDAGQCVF